jgi:glycosyltransferase involved in cell wall biosynthesis
VTSDGITVVIPTFNRADRLARLLESLQNLEPPPVPYEIIVADNGSTDDTAAIVRDFADRSKVPVHYVHECRRGASYARNAAVAAASGSIVAFTDDDQDVAHDWLTAIESAFHRYPDVQVIGGRVLPRWLHPPPDWLAPEIWGPVGLVDRGNEPFRISRDRWMCLPGGNSAWRRTALLAVRGFSGEYPRSQDREILFRYLLADGIAMFIPDMIVYHYLDRSRLTKRYFRSWNLTEGRMRAKDAFYDLLTGSGALRNPPPETRRLLGVPQPLYREWLHVLRSYVAARVRRRHAAAFRHELRLIRLSAYLRWRIELTTDLDSSLAHRAGTAAARAAARTAGFLGLLRSPAARLP